MSHLVLFGALATVSVVSGILVVANRNPVRSALCLVVNFLTLAALYLSLSAQFIAAVQVIVYAGAIMVLFLFVIMLLNLGSAEALKERGGLQAPVATTLALIFLAMLGAAGVLGGGLAESKATAETLSQGGTVESVGKALFDPRLPWLFPFELTSILLLVGIVGSIILAKRKV